jgi:hypothetical protein
MRTPMPLTNLTQIASFTSSICFTSFRLRTLKLSCGFFRRSHSLFSMLCALFDKITRVAYPSPIFTNHRAPVTVRALRRASEAQKHLSVSPFVATLTHSLLRNPFMCRSYANTRDGGIHSRTGPWICAISVQISPLDSALTETPPVTPLESALTKSPGGWSPTRSIRL